MKLTSTLLSAMLFSLFFESTFFSFPLFFIVSLLLIYIKRDLIYYIAIFVMGLLLDMMRMSPLGITPLCIFASYLLLYGYEKYFGSKDILVAIFIAVIAWFLYSYFLHYSLHLFLLAIVIGLACWGAYVFILRRRFA